MHLDEGIQLQDIVGILRRRAGVVAGVAGAVFLASIFTAAVLRNTYEAWATILVEPQTISKKLIEAGVEGSDLTNRLNLMTMQILSRGRLAKVIDELKLYPKESKEMTREEVISLMRSQIRVEPVLPELEITDKLGRARSSGDLEINTFQLFYRSESAKLAAAVANRLANDFIDEHIKDRVQVSGDTAEFISSELERLQGQLKEVEQRMADVKNANAGRLPEDLASNQRLLERTYDSLRDARTAYSLAESDRAFYAQQAIVAADAVPRGQEDLSPERKLDAVKLAMAEARARGYTDRHPDVIVLQQQMAELERQAQDDAREDAEGDKPANFAQQNARAEQQRAELRANAAKQDVERLQALVTDIQDRLAQTPRVAEQLSALEREYTHLFQSYQEYSAKQLEAGVAANMERRQKGEQFRLLEAAFEPPDPTSPNRLVIVLVGAMFGIALGGGVALLLETADTSFHGARQIQSALQLPVLAAVPRFLLASDRARIRRRRIATAAVAAGISGAVLVGSGIGYMLVNGTPGFVKTLIQGDEAPAPPGGPENPAPQG
jgi:protein tyrosine kinase modulator